MIEFDMECGDLLKTIKESGLPYQFTPTSTCIVAVVTSARTWLVCGLCPTGMMARSASMVVKFRRAGDLRPSGRARVEWRGNALASS